MKFSYKDLNAATIKMSQNMKANGECYLSANGLLDRMAKGANFNSRQELKAAMGKCDKPDGSNLTQLNVDEFAELRQEFIDFMSESYRLLLTENTDFIVHIRKHPTAEEALEVYKDNYGIDFFVDDEHGLFGSEFSFPVSKQVARFALEKLNSEVVISEFSSSRYESLNEMCCEFANKQVLAMFSEVEQTTTEKVIYSFKDEGMNWTDSVAKTARRELQKFWSQLAES